MRFTSIPLITLLAMCTTTATTAAMATVLSAPVAPAPHPGAGVLVAGGTTAPPESWSSIQLVNGNRFCSAGLIGPEWVATATHCVDRSPGERPAGTARGPFRVTGMGFRVGSNSADSGGTVHTAVEAHPAPGADVTLVRISPPATQAPLRLPDRAPGIGATVTLFGFGATGADGAGAQSPVLKAATTRLTRMGRDNLGAPALNLERVDGIAQPGDSGGPAVIDGVWYGVASTSDLRVNAQYTSVFHLRDWIRATAGL